MKWILIPLAIAFAGCAKDEVKRTAIVTFGAQCNGCELTRTGFAPDTLVGVSIVDASMDIGSEAVIRAVPLGITDTATSVWVKVDGFQQDFALNLPADSASMIPVEIRLTVPRLDRYGNIE